MIIVFTRHAEQKFKVLREHKFSVTREQVIQALTNPDGIDYSRTPLLIAQRKIDKRHVLRVVFKKENGRYRVITFYPGRIVKYQIAS